MKRITATARVRLTLEIPAGQTWNPDSSMSQIHKQAVDAVLSRLRRDQDLAMLLATGHARVIDPKVTAILATESDDE